MYYAPISLAPSEFGNNHHHHPLNTPIPQERTSWWRRCGRENRNGSKEGISCSGAPLLLSVMRDQSITYSLNKVYVCHCRRNLIERREGVHVHNVPHGALAARSIQSMPVRASATDRPPFRSVTGLSRIASGRSLDGRRDSA